MLVFLSLYARASKLNLRLYARVFKFLYGEVVDKRKSSIIGYFFSQYITRIWNEDLVVGQIVVWSTFQLPSCQLG